VQVELKDTTEQPEREFDDIRLRLESAALPKGTRPLVWLKDFGTDVTMMLTVASPSVDAVEISTTAGDHPRADCSPMSFVPYCVGSDFDV
jgi:hypothetical protein